MKIVCLQLEPKLGQVQRNIDRATEMISNLDPDEVDVLVLPEMAFTGYVFTSKDHIRPYLENVETGPSVQWAKEQAVRFRAYVVVGFPEKRTDKYDDISEKETYYNSSCLVSPQGKLLSVYSKHFLYYTDENWAEEGPGFASMPIDGLGKVGFGICIDVNPYQFKANFTDYEFANFHLDQKSDLILCSMAWNTGEESPPKAAKARKPHVKKDTMAVKTEIVESGESGGDNTMAEDSDGWEDADSDNEEEADEDEENYRRIQFETLQYWAVRMNPFYMQHQKPHHKAIFVVANRIGLEGGNLFVGSSCVFRLGADGPELLGTLPANQEGLLCIDTESETTR